jgi:hypothetical protein
MTNQRRRTSRAFGEIEQYRFGPAFLHSTLKEFVYDYYSHLDQIKVTAQRATASAAATKGWVLSEKGT